MVKMTFSLEYLSKLTTILLVITLLSLSIDVNPITELNENSPLSLKNISQKVSETFFSENSWNFTLPDTATDYFQSIDISADGKYIAGSGAGPLYLLQGTGSPLWYNETGRNHSDKWVKISDDGNYISTVTTNGQIRFFDNAGNLLWDHTIPGADTKAFDMSPDGNHIAFADTDNNLYYLNRTHGYCWNSSQVFTYIMDVAASVQGIIVGDISNLYYFLHDGTKVWTYPLSGYYLGSPFYNGIDISSDGEYIAVVADKVVGSPFTDKLMVLDTSMDVHLNYNVNLTNVRISADGKYITGTDPGTPQSPMCKIHYFNRSHHLWEVLHYNAESVDVAISADGSYAVEVLPGCDVRVYNRTGYQVHRWYGFDNDDQAKLAITADGQHIFVAPGYDNTLEPDLFFLDLAPPTIDTPGFITHELGTTGQIIWHPVDFTPHRYNITRGMDLLISDLWDGGSITYELDTLPVGVHEFVCKVNDTQGRSVGSNPVTVTVVDTTDPTIDHPTDLIYEEGVTGHWIAWTASDIDPGMYHVIYNETNEVVIDGDWLYDGLTINVTVDSHSVGLYSYNCTIIDESGNQVTDIVDVTVVASMSPTIDSPADISFEVGSTGHNLTWNPQDLSPDEFHVKINDTVNNSGSWDGEAITINLDDLLEGFYIIICTAIDELGNEVSDTVLVTVTKPPIITTTTTITPTTSETTSETDDISTPGFEIMSMLFTLIIVEITVFRRKQKE